LATLAAPACSTSALARLAWCEVFAGLPDADRFTTEALTLGQAPGVGPSVLARVFEGRALYLHHAMG